MICASGCHNVHESGAHSPNCIRFLLGLLTIVFYSAVDPCDPVDRITLITRIFPEKFGQCFKTEIVLRVLEIVDEFIVVIKIKKKKLVNVLF